MYRKDYYTVSNSIKKAMFEIVADQALTVDELKAMKRYHELIIDKLCQEFARDNDNFDKGKFLDLMDK